MPVNTSGIYIPGKIKIEDATATPSDVLKDKIFYNNNGRQIGNLDGYSLKSVTISANKSDDLLRGTTIKYFVDFNASYNGKYVNVESWTSGHSFYYHTSVELDGLFVLYIMTGDDIRIDMPVSIGLTKSYENTLQWRSQVYNNASVIYELMIVQRTAYMRVYDNHREDNASFTIYYI